MTCVDIEILICDAIDGTLNADAKTALDLHLRECTACAELARDAGAAVAFMERTAVVDVPHDLVTRIAHKIPTGKAVASSGLRDFFGRYLRPILQPRFAMGMAMTILSFSMLGRFAG